MFFLYLLLMGLGFLLALIVVLNKTGQLINMIFYSRKHKKNKTGILQQTSTSFSMLQPSKYTSKNSLKKINIRLMNNSKQMTRWQPSHKTQQMFQPRTTINNFVKRPPTSQLKKRTKDKIDIPSHLFGTLDITTTAWCLYDSSKKKYLGFRQDCKREVASLTKIMTTLLSIEILQNLQMMDLKVRITGSASSMIGTTASLKIGHWFNIRDLLFGAMLPSGNDAAFSLAQYIGYLLSVDPFDPFITSQNQKKIDLTKESTKNYFQKFLRAMNDKARSLGLYYTTFSNPHGLQNALNTSSPKDMIKLSRQAMKNNFFREIVNTKQHPYISYEDEEMKIILNKKWKNTNKLLDKGWQGIKTGCTTVAGNCLASYRDGIYIVVLHSLSDMDRFSDTEKIWSWFQQHTDERQTKSVMGIRDKSRCQYRSRQVTKTEASI